MPQACTCRVSVKPLAGNIIISFLVLTSFRTEQQQLASMQIDQNLQLAIKVEQIFSQYSKKPIDRPELVEQEEEEEEEANIKEKNYIRQTGWLLLAVAVECGGQRDVGRRLAKVEHHLIDDTMLSKHANTAAATFSPL
ncbi:hypothetical protein T03_10552 [Trichinella britovi]|uniref:Uncharacterized protein n=1 Tax=Trichinella britovi TaxID=45882 RepID=A0A0V1CMS4_TRIBR|nr:hypothetical protein T03_10552 [Trichinella britovi]